MPTDFSRLGRPRDKQWCGGRNKLDIVKLNVEIQTESAAGLFLAAGAVDVETYKVSVCLSCVRYRHNVPVACVAVERRRKQAITDSIADATAL